MIEPNDTIVNGNGDNEEERCVSHKDFKWEDKSKYGEQREGTFHWWIWAVGCRQEQKDSEKFQTIFNNKFLEIKQLRSTFK
jgi:hypothetical protein